MQKDIKKYYNDGLWLSGLCFYLDAKHFTHKTNPMDQAKAPKTLVWTKKNEDLSKGCTSKGNKAGHDLKKCNIFSTSKLQEHNGLMQSLKLCVNLCSFK